MKKAFVLITFYVLGQTGFAQSSPQFGNYTPEEIAIKECAFDKSADAVILFDEAVSTYDDDWQLVTSRRIRIKILNQRATDRGNIIIPFYSKDNFEFIRDIEGITYNPGDNNAMSQLSRKNIFTEKVNDRVSYMKFAMPNVKAGSIIEYKYTSVMKHYGGLESWFFQSELPTMRSSYLLQIIPNHEFKYIVFKKPNYPVTVTPKPGQGQIYYEMKNIPGLRYEAFMDAPKDYMQRVDFQLSGFTTGTGSQTKMFTNWSDISRYFASHEDLGGTMKKSLAIPEDLKALVDKETTDPGKTEAIYKYVRDQFTWNGGESKLTGESLKKIVERRSGTSGEINLVLINFLQAFKIEAWPLVAAERSFGRVSPDIPLIDGFNKTVAYVVADGKTYILDASQKHLPPGLVPYQLLNTYGLLIDRKQGKLIGIESANEAFKTKIIIDAALDKTGKLSGKADLSSYEYARQLQMEKINENQKSYVSEELQKPYEGLVIEDFNFEKPSNNSDALLQHVKFNNQISESGGFVLLNYNLFTGLAKNPFTSTERFTNINFGFPYQLSVEETIQLPSNFKIDNLPPNKMLVTPEKDIIVKREIKREGNLLKIKIDFNQSVTLIPNSDYNDLKEFYKQMTELLNEPVVVKLQ